MAKGIGNGLPLGAVVTTKEIAACLAERLHFNTFGGNPVCAAGGNYHHVERISGAAFGLKMRGGGGGGGESSRAKKREIVFFFPSSSRGQGEEGTEKKKSSSKQKTHPCSLSSQRPEKKNAGKNQDVPSSPRSRKTSASRPPCASATGSPGA